MFFWTQQTDPLFGSVPVRSGFYPYVDISPPRRISEFLLKKKKLTRDDPLLGVGHAPGEATAIIRL